MLSLTTLGSCRLYGAKYCCLFFGAILPKLLGLSAKLFLRVSLEDCFIGILKLKIWRHEHDPSWLVCWGTWWELQKEYNGCNYFWMGTIGSASLLRDRRLFGWPVDQSIGWSINHSRAPRRWDNRVQYVQTRRKGGCILGATWIRGRKTLYVKHKEGQNISLQFVSPSSKARVKYASTI